MTPNRVYKKLCKSPHTRNASQGIPDGGDFVSFPFCFVLTSVFLHGSSSVLIFILL